MAELWSIIQGNNLQTAWSFSFLLQIRPSRRIYTAYGLRSTTVSIATLSSSLLTRYDNNAFKEQRSVLFHLLEVAQWHTQTRTLQMLIHSKCNPNTNVTNMSKPTTRLESYSITQNHTVSHRIIHTSKRNKQEGKKEPVLGVWTSSIVIVSGRGKKRFENRKLCRHHAKSEDLMQLVRLLRPN